MKKETYFKQADKLYDSIIPTQRKIRNKCETFIKKFLQEHDNEIDFSDCDGSVTVSYDGGNHPEYASNAFSTVEAISLDDKGNIVLQTEDCSEYGIENINWEEVYWIAAFITDEFGENS